MEKGVDKKSSSNSDFVASMKLQNSTQVSPPKISMTDRRNLDRSFTGCDDDVGSVGGSACDGGSVGPTNKSGGPNEAVGFLYRDDISHSGGGDGGGNFAESTNLHTFDVLPSFYSTIPYSSPAAEMGFPFTAAQWKELERQTIIYKYMISSVPVHPHLLLPSSRNFSATTVVDSSVSSIYKGRYSRNGDPEPGRCKRTDGKKWRCSREVAPHQKYCERHLHRGRPRSRKPVEAKNNGENHKKTRIEQTKSFPTDQSNSASSQQLLPANESLLFMNVKTDLSISSPYYKATNRDVGLTTTMEGEMVSSEPPWGNMTEANMGLENCYFPQEYMEQQPLNLFSFPNLATPEIDLPCGFIDAWSIDNLSSRNNGNIEPSISVNKGDFSPSLNLSMAMAAGDIVDQEMRSIQTGDDVKYCLGDKTKDSLWPSSVSWEPFARGGPLGEALQPVGGSNPASPYYSISTPATTVSSPSGVLQWTLLSHSDGSVCNSPTFVGPPSEGLNQWHN